MRPARAVACVMVACLSSTSLRALPPGRSGTASSPAWLGIRALACEPSDGGTSRDVSPTPSEDEPCGVALLDVDAGGPAARAGLRAGDVIVGIDHERVADPPQLSTLLASHAPGDTVTLSVNRDGARREVAVLLGAAPDPQAAPRRQVLATLPGAEALARALVLEGKRARPCLGADLMEMSPGLSAYFGTRPGAGLLVSSVRTSSAAEAAGLRAGDVVLALDGHPFASTTQLADLLRDDTVGTKVAIDLVREGHPVTVTAALGSCTIAVWQVGSP